MISSAVAAATLLAMGSVGSAAIWTWDGGGADSNWGTANNWDPNTLPQSDAKTYVVFTGSTKTTNSNNLSLGSVGGVVFDSNASSFTLNGNALTLFGGVQAPYTLQGVTQESSAAQLINNAITIRSGVLLTGDGTGVVRMTNVGATSNNVSKTGTSTYFIDDADGTNFAANRTVNVNAGQLYYQNTTGSGMGAAGVSVLANATFGGNGQITPGDVSNSNRDVTIAANGILSPGTSVANSVGTMTLNLVNGGDLAATATASTTDLTLTSGAKFVFDLATPSTSDKVVLTDGVLRLNSQQFSDFTFNALSGFGNGVYTLFDSVGSLSTGGILNATPANLTGAIDGRGATLSLSNGDVILTIIPEPGAFALLGLGAIGLLARRRNRMA